MSFLSRTLILMFLECFYETINISRFLKLREQLQLTSTKGFFLIGQKKPLKIAILYGLFLPTSNSLSLCPNKKPIQFFMSLYTSTAFYKVALTNPNTIRIDLMGKQYEQPVPKKQYKAEKKENWNGLVQIDGSSQRKQDRLLFRSGIKEGSLITPKTREVVE